MKKIFSKKLKCYQKLYKNYISWDLENTATIINKKNKKIKNKKDYQSGESE